MSPSTRSTKKQANSKKTNPKKKKTEKKIFVLDTSVILFDHNSILNFAEHDVVIPITVLEELDEFKKGSDTKNFEARSFIRFLDNKAGDKSLRDWISLNGKERGNFKVVMDTDHEKLDAQKVYGENKADHRILNVALRVKDEEPRRKVILVTKDINLRLKAKALDIYSDDYQTGKVADLSNFHTGKQQPDNIPDELIDKVYSKHAVNSEELAESVPDFKKQKNGFYILKGARKSCLAFYNASTEMLEHVEKQICYGIKPRNAEQTFALHAIMNPEIKLITLTGVAGTGKTLLALAGSLQQKRDFKQIYLARPIVPLSNKDIGYLPGDEQTKITPYMQPLWDNIKFIKNQYGESDKEYKQIEDMINSDKILITPLAYIRGRSLSDVIFIVDEAQNLTPHEVKTIITRAGDNSKFIFTGDIRQIDTPYLDEQSNGLSYLVDKLKGNDLYAHISLEKGERSELANLANDLL